jgi:mono/diheme cytochrome c family protein
VKPRCCSLALLPLTLAAATLALAEAPDKQSIERGRYLSAIAGCNDCHTPGYLLSDGQVDEALWLTGDNFGWRGPWGTTYPPNLRLVVDPLTEDQWVAKARTLRSRPPMPWYTLNQMAEADLRDLYRFIKGLGPVGEPAPAYVPPGQEPATPYALFPSATQAGTSAM